MKWRLPNRENEKVIVLKYFQVSDSNEIPWYRKKILQEFSQRIQLKDPLQDVSDQPDWYVSYLAKFKAPSADRSEYFGAFVNWNGRKWEMAPDPKTKVFRTWKEKLPKYFRK